MEEHLKVKEIFKCYVRVGRILFSIDWKIFMYLCFTTIYMGASPNISVLAMQALVNEISKPTAQIRIILIAMLVYLLTDMIQTTMNNMIVYGQAEFNLRVNSKLNTIILNKTKEMNLSDFESAESYDLLKRAQMQNSSLLFSYFTIGLSIIQLLITTFFSTMIILSWNSWSVILIIMITMLNSILMLNVSRKQYKIVKERTSKTRETGYYQFLLTNDIAFKEIKAYSLHEYFIGKYKTLMQEFNTQDKNILKKIWMINNLQSFLEMLVDILILTTAVRDAITKRILVGDAITYIRCVSIIRSNVAGVMSGLVSVYKDTLYINQLFEFLDMKPDKKHDKVQITGISNIQITNLTYYYKGKCQPAVKNINLTLKKGDTISVVGKNGSGKTTLLKIIAGFYEDYTGTILVNGIDLKKIDIENYRSFIGLMFQDFNKYELSIRENIGLGNLNDQFDSIKIKKTMEITGLREELWANLDQQLGFWFKDGTQLSGGEWLKIAMSRVFFRNADMYILDEPNAALDPIAEKRNWANIKNRLKGKIGIVITHHLRINEQLDKIIVMENGEIVDSGTHKELLCRSELYCELYKSAV